VDIRIYKTENHNIYLDCLNVYQYLGFMNPYQPHQKSLIV